jgi:alpha-ketoglutarate-dependent taurine dioxygenase
MLTIKPLHGNFGAEISGVPSSLEIDDLTFREIEQAWFRHSILRFRNLSLTPGQQIAFSRRLGPLHIMEPLNMNLEGFPEIFLVSNEVKDGKPIGLKRAGEGFHTDGEDKILPNAGSFLYAIKVPPERGDTLFVNMYSAYDGLHSAIKQKLDGKRARFSRIDLHHVHYPHLPALTEEQKRARPDVYHPILRRHPHSGRTALYIGRWATDIEGLPAGEGKALLKELQEFVEQPRYVFRQVWRERDAILWDNRCTQHCATGFDDEKYVRTMYRTTLEGDIPIMATS